MNEPAVTRRQLILAQASGDAAILEAAIEMEQEAAFAYAALADSGRLGELAPAARLFARQEEEHAAGLIRALRDRGGAPPAKPEGVGDVPGLKDAAAGTRGQVVAFAVELETAAVAAYHQALAGLQARELLSMAASIMANQAQHLVVLRESLGEEAVPDAFVTPGRRTDLA